jgi:hypothetical protein
MMYANMRIVGLWLIMTHRLRQQKARLSNANIIKLIEEFSDEQSGELSYENIAQVFEANLAAGKMVLAKPVYREK